MLIYLGNIYTMNRASDMRASHNELEVQDEGTECDRKADHF